MGLLDYSDPESGKQIREKLDALGNELGPHYHGVRYRTTGYRQIIEVHLLFPHATAVGEAHRAGHCTGRTASCRKPAEVIPHLESLEDQRTHTLDRAQHRAPRIASEWAIGARPVGLRWMPSGLS